MGRDRVQTANPRPFQPLWRQGGESRTGSGAGRKTTSSSQQGAQFWPGSGRSVGGGKPHPPPWAQSPGPCTSEAGAQAQQGQQAGLLQSGLDFRGHPPGLSLGAEPQVGAWTQKAARLARKSPAGQVHCPAGVGRGRPARGVRGGGILPGEEGMEEEPGKHRTCPSLELGPRGQT